MISCQPLKRATSTPSATGATRSSVNLELSPVSLVLLFARVSRELGPVSLHTSQRSTVEKTTDRVGSVLSSDTSFCKKCISVKLHGLCCLPIGQCVRCSGTAWYWSLIHMVIHIPCTSFVDRESGGGNCQTLCRHFLHDDLCRSRRIICLSAMSECQCLPS